MVFDFSYFLSLIPILLKGLKTTLSISLVSFVIAITLGILLALAIYYEISFLKWLSKLYISFFRGTPLLAQLYFLYFGMPIVFPIFKGLTSFSASILGLGLNMSAYMAETIRATISSVDKGQTEAGLVVGLTRWQIMKKIVIPQASRVAIPSLFNNFIDLIKGSSIAFTIGATEVMAQAKMAGAISYRYFEAYGAAMLVYWIIVICFTHLQKKLELKLAEAY